MPKSKKPKRKRKMTAEAVIFDSSGRVLLVKQGQPGRGWELPGGKVKKRESLPDAVCREVLEETGVQVTPQQLLGVFFIPSQNTYDFVVRCQLVLADEPLKPNPPETVDCNYFPIDKLPKKIAGFTIDRINDALEGIIHPLPVELTAKQWLG
jgi:8-oxo-dGTP pyrophosphatase MutT (NUDIX family)